MVLINLVAGNFPANDFCEDVLVVIWRHASAFFQLLRVQVSKHSPSTEIKLDPGQVNVIPYKIDPEHAAVPAYLRDMFCTRYVGAIHGILLTAWSAAGIAGPVLINYIREYNITHGVPKADAYNVTMYIMAGLLVIGFIANAFVKAVDKRHHMVRDTDAEADRARGRGVPAAAQAAGGA